MGWKAGRMRGPELTALAAVVAGWKELRPEVIEVVPSRNVEGWGDMEPSGLIILPPEVEALFLPLPLVAEGPERSTLDMRLGPNESAKACGAFPRVPTLRTIWA